MRPDRVLAMIGMAAKAGRIASGEFATEKEVKCAGAFLVLIAEDASENTKKKFQNMCDFYEVPLRFYGDRETLGHAIGKEFRASVAVLDEGFTKSILRQLDNR